jgi:hypothetical protein
MPCSLQAYVPAFTVRCPHVTYDVRDPSSERWNSWARNVRWFCLNVTFHVHLGIFYMPKICDMGPTVLLPLRRKAYWEFFRP